MLRVKFHVRQTVSTPWILAVIISNNVSFYISKQKSLKQLRNWSSGKKNQKDEELKHSLLHRPTKMDNIPISSYILHLTEDRDL